MRLAGIAVLALAIAGCTEVTEAVDSTARAGAKGLSPKPLPPVSRRFPRS
ncbi:hypothetical protein ACFQFQ_15980 [Sulfitobacter porphyrae]|uniref:Lipoprotein n=1 Tax=Sulfitobacter porphyrae TaxID=1246864 RepID=A0ABW2B4J0_9RHOB